MLKTKRLFVTPGQYPIRREERAMKDYAGMPIEALLRLDDGQCACGRRHLTDLRYLKIGPGAIANLPDMLKTLGCSRPMLVCDGNTWEAAGKRAAGVLDAAGIRYGLCRYETKARLNPAERELGSLAMRCDPTRDILVGVGGGVINDLCKLMAKAAGVPSAIVATAPSMDGIASNSGAMEVGGVKKTIYTSAPAGVLCDTDIMAHAPERMLRAGVGDMIAKYVSICDWRVSNAVNGEYYCENIAGMMRAALQRVMANLDGVTARDPEAVGAVAEGLVRAGLAMSLARVSRPASGLEHCFSHIWEMMALERGRTYDLHGIQVGVGTMLVLSVYRRVRQLRPDMARVEARIAEFDPAAWEANLRRVFGRAAEPLIAQAAAQRKNDPDARRARASRIIEKWDVIQAIIEEELPDEADLRQKMKAIGLPMRPADIGISDQDALDAFVCSRDIRDRYLLSSMLWDIGCLQEGAEALKMALEEEET